ncbi:hypothetical protein [Rhodoplanes sp. SY1]|uniref:hypothetical protein n=1 Tax=Rhodoplanes sp. SY1 TaxID=3166646 RepID=UPI0038B68C53
MDQRSMEIANIEFELVELRRKYANLGHAVYYAWGCYGAMCAAVAGVVLYGVLRGEDWT